MKIAVWNVERLRHKKALYAMLHEINRVRADILVLTETSQLLHPEYRYCLETPLMAKLQPELYAPAENRVSVYTNYPVVCQHKTCDENTALCVELGTERGNLLVYGTIIGVFGNRHPSFMTDLTRQMNDVQRLSNLGDGFCICGDFNCSFADNYYFTKAGRDAILNELEKSGVALLTKNQPECVDHVAVSRRFIGDAAIQIEEWNCDKALSDHKGIAAAF